MMHYLVQNKRETSPTVGWILCKRPAMMFWSQKWKGAKIPTVQWHFFKLSFPMESLPEKLHTACRSRNWWNTLCIKSEKRTTGENFSALWHLVLGTMALGGKFCISAHGCTLCKHTLPQLFCCEGFEFVFILLFYCWLMFFLQRTRFFLSNTNGFLRDKIKL